MEIKNRLFPYPVLCDETDDYKINPNIISEIHESINDINIVVKFDLSNWELLKLVRKGYADYVLHFECSSTSFRKVIRTDVSEITYSIPKSKVNVEVTVLAMLVAKVDINNFKSSALNDDYLEETISFDKGSILAYKNLPRIYVYKNYEELASNESIFSIVKVGLPDDDEVESGLT
jgi:hypothetical protein